LWCWAYFGGLWAIRGLITPVNGAWFADDIAPGNLIL